MKTLKSIFMLIIFVGTVFFCTKNASPVTLDLLFTKIETQLYIMMLSALLLGAFLVGFAAFFEHARVKRHLKKLQKQHIELQSKVKQMEKSQEVSDRGPLSLPQASSNSR